MEKEFKEAEEIFEKYATVAYQTKESIVKSITKNMFLQLFSIGVVKLSNDNDLLQKYNDLREENERLRSIVNACRYPIQHLHNGNHDESELLGEIDAIIENTNNKN